MLIFLKIESFFKELIWSFLAGVYILYSFFSILTLNSLKNYYEKHSLTISYSMFQQMHYDKKITNYVGFYVMMGV